jgi:peptide/nickel transport system substrate-binding protein
LTAPVQWFTILQPSCPLSDPHMWTDGRDRLSLRYAVYETLVRYGPDGRYQPDLAAAWLVEEDATTWTFEIRKGVRFHNDTPLTAEAVVSSLDRARGPGLPGELGTTGLYRSYLRDAEVRALDEHRVRVVTAGPMADLLDLLVEIPIVAPGDLAAGTGRYQVTEARLGEVWMEAVRDHRDGPAAYPRLLWGAEPSESRRLQALLDGEADLVTDLLPQDRAAIAGSNRGQFVVRDGKVAVVFMCNAAAGACADVRVRRALNYALDVPALIRDAVGGAAQPLNGPLTPRHYGYDPDTAPYPHDPARARTLLAAAGYGTGLTLVIDIPTTHPDEAPGLAELMTRQYAEVGVTVQVETFDDRPAYAEMVKAKRIDDACCFDSSPLSTWRVLREKFHAGVRGAWWQGYGNPEVDALLDQAATVIDADRRQALYRRASRLIRDDAPWIFLYSPTLAWGRGPQAGMTELGVDGAIRFT